MALDIDQYRAAVGLFNSSRNLSYRIRVRHVNTNTNLITFLLKIQLVFLLFLFIIEFVTLFCFVYFQSSTLHYIVLNDLLLNILCQLFFMKMQLLRCGDIHSNPGPSDKNKLSISHWNLNSLSVRNFEKLGSIEAFNAVVNHDIICLSETFLNSSFSTDDSNLNLKGSIL